MSKIRAIAFGAAAVAAALVSPVLASPVLADEAVNDFPTVARADYVFACMQVNGQSREALNKCACSVDVIASLIPFEEYEAVETVMMVYQRGGKAQQQMSNGDLQRRIKEMRRAQVEGELRCF
jgi:hypothetical protein